MSVTQLPMDIPAVAKWYIDVDRHTAKCRGDERCPICKTLQNRMLRLREQYRDRLVTL